MTNGNKMHPVLRLPDGGAGLELARFHSNEVIASYLYALHQSPFAASPDRGRLFDMRRFDNRNVVGGVQDAATYPNPNQYPITVGIGFDQLRNRPAGRVIKDAPLINLPNNSPLTMFKLVVISDSIELRTTLALSAGASISALGGNGGGRLEIYRDSNLNRFSNYVMVAVTVVFGAKGFVDYRFANKEIERDYNTNPQRFFEKYGTEFISAVVMGGEFLAVLEVQSETRSEYEAQKTALSIKSGMWTSSAEFSNNASLIHAFNSKRLAITRLGTTEDLPATSEDLIKYAVSFPSKIENNEHAAILFFSTQSYSRINNIDKTLDFRKPLNALANAVDLRDRLNTLKRDWVQVATFPQWYAAPDVARAADRIRQIDDHLRSVLAYATVLQDDPFGDHAAPEVNLASMADLPQIYEGSNLALTVSILQWRRQSNNDLLPMSPIAGGNGQWVPDAGYMLFIDSFAVNFNRVMPGLGLEYMAHLADIGDTGYVPAGTPTPSQWHQGVAFRLTGPLAGYFTVRYRVRAAGIGESAYVSDGVLCGTRGEYRPITSILVEVLLKR